MEELKTEITNIQDIASEIYKYITEMKQFRIIKYNETEHHETSLDKVTNNKFFRSECGLSYVNNDLTNLKIYLKNIVTSLTETKNSCITLKSDPTLYSI